MKRDNTYLIGNQYAANTGPNKTSFKKGRKPWNKDKKGIHLSPKTEFKKGRKSINYLPVGTIRERLCKGNPPKKRNFIKVADPNKWVEYAKIAWVSWKGEIPKGCLIHHIDENTLNDDIDNLALLTRKAHFEIHGIGKMGRDTRRNRNKR